MDQYVDLAFLAASVTPALILAGIGYLFTDKAGVFNIGLEGLMLIAAFVSAVVQFTTGSAALAIAAGTASSLAVSLLFYLFAIILEADVIIVGIAVNLLAGGLTTFLVQRFYGLGNCCQVNPSSTVPIVTVPLLNRAPIIGPSVDSQSLFVYASWMSVAVASVILYRTRLGLHLRAVGENAEAAATVGIDVNRTRLYALLLCGTFCGLAGCFFSQAQQEFSQNMTAGYGFIALAAETFGNATPLGTFLACVFFGLTQSFSDHLNSLAGDYSQFVTALPYVLTVVALVVAGVRFRRRRTTTTAAVPQS